MGRGQWAWLAAFGLIGAVLVWAQVDGAVMRAAGGWQLGQGQAKWQAGALPASVVGGGRYLGVNRSGTEYACAQGNGLGDGKYDQASVQAMKAWGVNTVRVPLNEDCWLGINGVKEGLGGANYRGFIKGYVAELARAGIGSVLDLHWSAPGESLALGQAEMADADHSGKFWKSVAGVFANRPGVSFDVFNEPHGISNACWVEGCQIPDGNGDAWLAMGMQDLIDAVRSTGARNPIWVSGNDWGNDLGAMTQLEDPAHSLVGSLHAYSGDASRAWLPMEAEGLDKVNVAAYELRMASYAATNHYPLVLGEVGEFDCQSGFASALYAYADLHNVGYLGWNWGASSAQCASGPSLTKDAKGTPTDYGLGLKRALGAASARSKMAGS